MRLDHLLSKEKSSGQDSLVRPKVRLFWGVFEVTLFNLEGAHCKGGGDEARAHSSAG